MKYSTVIFINLKAQRFTKHSKNYIELMWKQLFMCLECRHWLWYSSHKLTSITGPAFHTSQSVGMLRVSFTILIEAQNFILWESQKTQKQPQNLNTECSLDFPWSSGEKSVHREQWVFHHHCFLWRRSIIFWKCYFLHHIPCAELGNDRYTEFLCTDNFLLICVNLHI